MQAHAEKGFKSCSVFFPSAATPANKMPALLERLTAKLPAWPQYSDSTISQILGLTLRTAAIAAGSTLSYQAPWEK